MSFYSAVKVERPNGCLHIDCKINRSKWKVVCSELWDIQLSSSAQICVLTRPSQQRDCAELEFKPQQLRLKRNQRYSICMHFSFFTDFRDDSPLELKTFTLLKFAYSVQLEVVVWLISDVCEGSQSYKSSSSLIADKWWQNDCYSFLTFRHILYNLDPEAKRSSGLVFE